MLYILLVILYSERHDYVETLVTAAAHAVPSTDVTLLIVDAAKKFHSADKQPLSELIDSTIEAQTPLMVVLNKVNT